MYGFTILDIVTILLVGGGLAFGFFRGFVYEVLTLFAWVLAVLALRFLHTPLTLWLTGLVGSPTGSALFMFALLFFGALLTGKLIAGRLGQATRQSVVGPVDRVLGAGFGALKGLIGVTLLFLAVNLGYDLLNGRLAPRPAWMADGRTYPLLHASSRAIVDFVEWQRGPAAEEEEESRPGKAK